MNVAFQITSHCAYSYSYIVYLADIKISMSGLPQNCGILGKVRFSQSFRVVTTLHDRVERESDDVDNLGPFLISPAKPEPILCFYYYLLFLSKFLPVVLYHATTYYSCIILNIYCISDNDVHSSYSSWLIRIYLVWLRLRKTLLNSSETLYCCFMFFIILMLYILHYIQPF